MNSLPELAIISLIIIVEMRYVAAFLLGALSGKDPGSAEIEKILGSVGIEADPEKLNKVLNELKGKNIEELMTSGKQNTVFIMSRKLLQ